MRLPKGNHPKETICQRQQIYLVEGGRSAKLAQIFEDAFIF